MQAMLNIATTAAIQAGKVINQHYDRFDAVKVSRKGHNDFVTEVDRKAEECIIYHIHKAHPSHSILAEESGQQGEHDFCWVIDPLDGTANFMHGFPQFAVSIALRKNGETKLGVVYDPLANELYTAISGSGARMNNRRIRVGKKEKLADSLIGTGFPFRSPENIDLYLKVFTPMLKQASDIRRSGSAALDLAYVAAGRLDGYWESDLNIWDVAAGALLVKEAGGIVTDLDGGNSFNSRGDVLAANKPVHQQMHSILTTQSD